MPNHVLPIFWKAKNIRKVLHSSKEAESQVLEQVLFNKNKKVTFVGFHTDSMSLLDYMVSIKQIEMEILWPIITRMKEYLVDSMICFYRWLEKEHILANSLTTKYI